MKTKFEIVYHEGSPVDLEPSGYSIEYLGDEPENDADAWKITLAKWKFIVDNIREIVEKSVDDGGQSTCGLCKLHGMTLCQDCPIALYNSMIGCGGTPYIEFTRLMWFGREEDKILDRFLALAMDELVFLKKMYKKWKSKKI